MKKERNAKQRISEALLKLLEEKTIHEITIGELCTKSHIARTTYYYYYRTMEETLEDVFFRAIQDLLNENKNGRWEDAILGMLRWMRNHPSVCANLQDSIKIQQINTVVVSCFEPGMRLRMSHFVDQYEVSEEQKDFIITCSIHSLIAEILAWANTGMVKEPDVILDQVMTAYDGFSEMAMKNFERKNRGIA